MEKCIRGTWSPTMLVLVALGVFSCGSDGSKGSSPSSTAPKGGGASDDKALDDKTLSSLSTQEQGAACDEIADATGGYGKQTTTDCGGGTTVMTSSLFSDQASCTQTFMNAPSACADVTVGQLKTCIADSYNQMCGAMSTPDSCKGLGDCSNIAK